MRKLIKYVSLSALLGLTAVLAVPSDSQSVGLDAGQGDDVTTSLGSFFVWVLPPHRVLFENYSNYDAATGVLASGVLYDPATVIGRSDSIRHGSAQDLSGVLVGSDNVLVSDNDFTIGPMYPIVQGPQGYKEIHTIVADLNMRAFGASPSEPPCIRAGNSAPGRNPSPGEVESLGGEGLPGESFFNVYVEVDLPDNPEVPWGQVMTLYNPLPLLVQADEVYDLPPRVVYTHSNPTAVPILFANDGNLAIDTLWKEGMLFGWLLLAGHGMSYTDDPLDFEDFLVVMDNTPPMPCIPCGDALPLPATTPYGMMILALLLVAAAVWLLRRKRLAAGI